MTKDYTRIGRYGAPAPALQQAPAALAHSRRIIVAVVYASALAFLLAGLWLLFGEQTLFPGELAKWQGIAFVVTAVADVFIAGVLKRVWARQDSARSPTA